jgi:hypothetical protein
MEGSNLGGMVQDSSGNLHFVWVNGSGGIFYGRTDPNGTLLSPRKSLGTTNLCETSTPRTNIDGQDQLHITWTNSTGPYKMRAFEYVRLSSTGTVLFAKHGAGGDDILGLPNGFAALRYYNDSSPVAKANGTLDLLVYDNNGVVQKNLTVGYHPRGFENADLLLNPAGDIVVVFLRNGTTLNMTVVHNNAVSINQTVILSGRVNLTSPRISVDADGKLQLLWVDEVPSPSYGKGAVYHMRLNQDGTKLDLPKVLLVVKDTEFTPKELSFMESGGFDTSAVVVHTRFAPDGYGGWPPIPIYLFAAFTKNGTLLESEQNFFAGGVPTFVVQEGKDLFTIGWGTKMASGSGGGGGGPGQGTDYGDILMIKTLGFHNVDLSVNSTDITYPSAIFKDEGFTLNVTVRNLGDWPSENFTINLTDNATNVIIGHKMAKLGAFSNTTLQFPLTLQVTTDIKVTVDPLLNNESDLSNNEVMVQIKVVKRPDFLLHYNNITFSNLLPTKDQTIEVTAIIENQGGLGASADVLFYDGINGTFINKMRVDFNTSYTSTSIFWAPQKIGLRTMFVRITNATPPELPTTLSNNAASTSIFVGSKTLPSIEVINPSENGTLEIGTYKISGQAWDPDGDNLTVFVRVDGGPWEQAATIPNATIAGVDWFIQWDFSDKAKGNHTIGAQVKDDVHLNDTLVHIHLVRYLVPFTVLGWAPLKDPTINENQSQLFEVFIGNPHNLNITYLWTLDGDIMNKTSKLNITTTYDAAGVYNVTVMVSYDDLVWDRSWTLTVKDVNRPPVLNSHSPQNNTQIMRYETTTNFEINVTDDDGDALNYTWMTNGKLLNSTKGWARISFVEDGNYYVNVTVRDSRGGIVNYSWTVKVKYVPPPCCSPPPKNHTYLEDMFLVIMLVIGGMVIVLLAVIYIRYGRLGKGKKKQGKPEVGESPMENEMTPAGHIR